MINRFLNKLKERYHNFFTWQDNIICQECGKKIGVYGVSFGTEEEINEEFDKKLS